MRFALTLGVCTLALLSAATAQMPEPKVCDLDVLYIQRTPRQPGYLPKYDLPGREGQPLLVKKDADGKDVLLTAAEVEAAPHWPKEGETVTYTAVVENKGAADAPPFEFTWSLDGREVKAGKMTAPLKSGERVELTYEWPWKQERHKIDFWADPMRRVRQFSYANDQRSVWTHAKLLVCYVDSLTYASFARSRNFLGTYSFEDWCQAHADWMNLLFERSVYPLTAPEGILDRVSVDFIGVLPEDKAQEERWKDSSPLKEGWDGGWWFGRNKDSGPWAAGMDWGLIHEWGHQFGLTDLYALDIACECNLILDKTGSPILIGRWANETGTMMHGHGPVRFAEDQAIALNYQLWRRRGYYGDYYYRLAENNYVSVTGADGKPVAGAKLQFWQRSDETGVLEGQPTFAGETGSDGRFLLPNREAPPLVTFGEAGEGYRLRPNPFGKINVVGSNDVMFVQIDARGQTDYAYIEITQFNLARERARSDKEATVAIPTQLPAEGAAAAPAAPKAAVSGNEVTLKLQGENRWTVLRADPTQYEWKKVGRAENGTFTDKMPRSGLYRYAAVIEREGKDGEDRKVSARSEPVGVVMMGEPWGLAVAPDGTAYVRDRANGQTLVIRRDGSAVGFVGSVHWHLEGSFDHALDAKGMVYVAKWPDGYDPKHSWIRRIDPKGKGREYDRTDIAGGEWDAAKRGRFKEPMGIWVSPKDGRVVVADTGNDRVQILGAGGQEDPGDVIPGLSKPNKAMLVGDQLVVCDTGAKRVVIFAKEFGKESAKGAGEWKEIKSIDLFERPTYCCAGLSGQVWIADQGMGRIVAVDPKKWQLTEWSFPAKGQPKIDDLRGIGCDEKAGDLLYIEGKARQLLRQHVQD